MTNADQPALKFSMLLMPLSFILGIFTLLTGYSAYEKGEGLICIVFLIASYANIGAFLFQLLRQLETPK